LQIQLIKKRVNIFSFFILVKDTME